MARRAIQRRNLDWGVMSKVYLMNSGIMSVVTNSQMTKRRTKIGKLVAPSGVDASASGGDQKLTIVLRDAVEIMIQY